MVMVEVKETDIQEWLSKADEDSITRIIIYSLNKSKIQSLVKRLRLIDWIAEE
jgi:hypothetical protein